MSSIKLKFRPSASALKEGALYFQIIHNRVVRRVNTAYRIFSEEWDAEDERIVDVGKGDARSERLSVVLSDVKWDLCRFAEVEKSLASKDYDVDDVVRLFQGEKSNAITLFAFVRGQIERLKLLNRVRCSETMNYTLRSFMKFRGGVDIEISKLGWTVIEQYEAWLKAKGVKRNTSSFYMRNLRTAYRAAVDEGLTEDGNPFRRVYTGVDKTVKRAISLEEIRRIRRLDLGKRPALEFARDLLMFSFYMRGMSFVDMAFLRKKDVHGGRIVYRRKKTGQELTIEVAPEAQGLIAKFASPTRYLLPIITAEDGTERRQYKNRITMVNRNLKKIGELAGLSIPLSTYVMRHSWATIARDKGIELAVISEALGHDNEATTQIYLDSISTAKVDKANRAILDDL
ncbi:MAG: site-specific integrase [Prevotella sp.]|nr:site-specific integrase [Prevotella sp.]